MVQELASMVDAAGIAATLREIHQKESWEEYSATCYLEEVLWPQFGEDEAVSCSVEHIVSILGILAHRLPIEKDIAILSLSSDPKWTTFIRLVLDLPVPALDIQDATVVCVFLSHLLPLYRFNRAQAPLFEQLLHVGLWRFLSSSVRDHYLHTTGLHGQWNEADKSAHKSDDDEMMVALVKRFCTIVSQEQVSEHDCQFLIAMGTLMRYLLSDSVLGMILSPLVIDYLVLVHAKYSNIYSMDTSVKAITDSMEELVYAPAVEENTTDQLTLEQKVEALQRLAFKKHPDTLFDLTVASVYDVVKRHMLCSLLAPLSQQDLMEYSRLLGITPLSLDMEKQQMLDILSMEYQARSSIRQRFLHQSVFPTEAQLWQSHVNLEPLFGSYSSIEDLCYRSCQDVSTELAASLRQILEEIVEAMAPSVHEDRTVFTGWHVNAVPIQSFLCKRVGEAILGQRVPSRVECVLTMNVDIFEGDFKQAWNQLKAGDTVSLLSAHIRNKDQLQIHVRVARVTSMTDGSGRRLIRSEGMQDHRELFVDLDPVQYQKDADQDRLGHVYGSFNLLVRHTAQQTHMLDSVSSFRQLLLQGLPKLPSWLNCVLLHNQGDTQHTEGGSKVVLRHLNVPRPVLESLSPGSNGEARQLETCVRILVPRVNSDDSLVVEAASTPGEPECLFDSDELRALVHAQTPGVHCISGTPGSKKEAVCVELLRQFHLNSKATGKRVLLVCENESVLERIMAALAMEQSVDAMLLATKTESDTAFSSDKQLDLVLKRIAELLGRVRKLATILGLTQTHAENASFSCESASHFYASYVLSRYASSTTDNTPFPFKDYFDEDTSKSDEEMKHTIDALFATLKLLQPFELLRQRQQQRTYFESTIARTLGMSLQYAIRHASRCKDILGAVDTVLYLDASSMTELDILFPLWAVAPSLDRVVLFGDSNQRSIPKHGTLSCENWLDFPVFSRVSNAAPLYPLSTDHTATQAILDTVRFRHPVQSKVPVNESLFVSPFQFVSLLDLCTAPVVQEGQRMQCKAEAEFIVALYFTLQRQGMSPSAIGIAATFHDQIHLIRDMVHYRTQREQWKGKAAFLCHEKEIPPHQRVSIILCSSIHGSTLHIPAAFRLINAASVSVVVFGRLGIPKHVHRLYNVIETEALQLRHKGYIESITCMDDLEKQ